MPSTAVVWFRRDLRVHDHPALAAAVEAADRVVPVFVLDDALLRGRWPAANRLWFMRESVAALSRELAVRGAALRVLRGRPADILPALARETAAGGVYLTRDATPYGRRRDREVGARLSEAGVALHAKRGLYVHEPDEVLTRDGRPYVVYGPFRRAWEARPRRSPLPAPDRVPGPPGALPDPIADLGRPTADSDLIPEPGELAARARLAAWLDAGVGEYDARRNRMDLDGTSRLSQDLRWGLVSPLEVVDRAEGSGEARRVFVSELAWREFYAHVLWHHPRVVAEPFRPALAAVPWRDDPVAFEAWREGRTGYPVVDAAMRQLRAAGFVHNRARMIAASFLAKHLLLDYRLGEAEFMRHLTDGDLASNNGGWQWTAGTGTDPQPWFRVFNPTLQGRRFDPDGEYVRRWVPELRGIAGGAVHEPWLLGAAAQA
ncbi:MAG: DNA photolyase family protein, partial [Chloroflexi bacterium]|nr:DNA photolyase family protein [Chloroflexota bacterium]